MTTFPTGRATSGSATASLVTIDTELLAWTGMTHGVSEQVLTKHVPPLGESSP